MKKSVLFIPLFVCLFLAESQAQWRNIADNSNTYFRQLSFGSEHVGFAVLDDSGTARTTYHQTLDAGLSWNEIDFDSVAFAGAAFHDVCFPDPDIGYVAVRKNSPVRAEIYKTLDSGKTWVDVSPDSVPPGFGVSDLNFVDQDYGFLCIGDQIFKTTDGGGNWSRQTVGRWGGLNEVHFYDHQYGIMAGWDGTFFYRGSIYTTSDSGKTWDSLGLAPYNSSVGQVYYAGPTTGYVLGENGFGQSQKLYRTFDNGNQWDTIVLTMLQDSSDQAMDLLFVSDSIGYIATIEGYILKSTNAGQTWTWDHKDKRSIYFLATNSKAVYSGGPLNTLIVNDVYLSIPNTHQKEVLTVYPNPVSQNGILHFSRPLTGNVWIHDSQGRLIHEYDLNEQDFVELEECGFIPPGNYFLIVQGESRYTYQLIIE